jgi:hypothetical protein
MGSSRKTLNPFGNLHSYQSGFAIISGHLERVTATIFGSVRLSILNSGNLPFCDKTSLRIFVGRVESR